MVLEFARGLGEDREMGVLGGMVKVEDLSMGNGRHGAWQRWEAYLWGFGNGSLV